MKPNDIILEQNSFWKIGDEREVEVGNVTTPNLAKIPCLSGSSRIK